MKGIQTHDHRTSRCDFLLKVKRKWCDACKHDIGMIVLCTCMCVHACVYACMCIISMGYTTYNSAPQQRPPVFYQRMFQAMSLLVDFLYANGNGLEMDAILIKPFEVNSTCALVVYYICWWLK